MSASYVDGKPTFQILELPADTAVPGPQQVHGNMTEHPAGETGADPVQVAELAT